MKQISFFILTLILLGCNDSDKKLDENLKKEFEKSKEEKKPRDEFPTYIKIDTFYTKPSFIKIRLIFSNIFRFV